MIKDVLVHLDGSAADELRLRHAEAIASTAGAHLAGLFTSPIADIAPLMPADTGIAAADVLADLDDEARRKGDLAQQRLAERFSRLAVPNGIRRIDGTPGQLANRAVSEARRADLFVASRPYDENGKNQWSNLFEAVLFESGRGIYIVPRERPPADAVRRLLVAWSDTRETAHALGEAAPFLANATQTVLLMVDPKQARKDEPHAAEIDLPRHLDRYGAPVEVTLVESEGRPVSGVILDQAHRISADLIVMGGYGHSRAREWVLGGVTREIFERSEFPILTAH